MDDDWDLQAVVRGFTTTTTTPSTSTPTTAATTTTAPPSSTVGFSSLPQKPPQNGSSLPQKAPQNDNRVAFEDIFRPRNEKIAPITDLCDIYKPFVYKRQSKTLSPQNVPVSPLSVLGGYQDLSSSQQQQQAVVQQTQLQVQPRQLSSSSGVMKSVNTRSKRRKNQMKRVCQVPAEGLSSDMWSWRKYGQKPIKGSPYPRGYYKCSTAKGCLARKQVERNRSDPNMFIITYTAEHNHPMPAHRNSLAGITRQKPSTSGDAKPASSLPESPGTTLLAALEKVESSREEKGEIIEEDNDDDDDFGISDMPLDDDFFAGLDDQLPLPRLAPIEDFRGPFPENGQISWLANNATTTATSGGF